VENSTLTAGFESTRFKPCNRYTTALLVINQATNLIDLAKKAFPANESRTQARKYKRNLKLQICNEAKSEMVFKHSIQKD